MLHFYIDEELQAIQITDKNIQVENEDTQLLQYANAQKKPSTNYAGNIARM